MEGAKQKRVASMMHHHGREVGEMLHQRGRAEKKGEGELHQRCNTMERNKRVSE
jgi:hypothetical protein